MSERGTFCWVRPWVLPPTGRRRTNCGKFLPFSAFRPNLRLKSGWNRGAGSAASNGLGSGGGRILSTSRAGRASLRRS